MTTAYTASNNVPLAALPNINGIVQKFLAVVTNPADATYAPDGLSASPVFGLGGQALQGNEIVAGGIATVVSYIGPLLNSGVLCWVLLECVGGAQQVAPAVQSQHAVQLSQLTGLVGAALNVKMTLAAASATATITADQIVVATGLNGNQFKLPSFSKTINLGTTGALGMDTGSAPMNGYVALYAGYNPNTGATTAWATNAATLQGAVYGGANALAGYTASALISVWPTNGSGQFKVGAQRDRNVFFPVITVQSNGTQTSFTSFSLSTAVPANAKSWGGTLGVTSTTTVGLVSSLTVAGDVAGSGGQISQITGNASATGAGFPISNVPILTAQTGYYSTANPNGNGVNISSYSF